MNSRVLKMRDRFGRESMRYPMHWMPTPESVSQFDQTVIPGEPASLPRTRYGVGRDPWFDRLTTLSEVEGESRKIAGTQIIMDPGSHPAPRDLAGMTNCHTVSSSGMTRERRQGHFQDAYGTLERPPSTPWTAIGFALILLMLSGCAYSQKGIHEPIHTIYLSHGEADSLISRFVPVFLIYNYGEPHNRIGRPSARFDARGNEQIYVDHEKPAIYHQDLFVGTDKVYADREITENPFYTSLKPWNRNSSDMWHFADFLEFWGWRL